MKLIINKSLINFFSISLLFCLSISFSFAADFIVPVSGEEPVVIDISGLNITGGADVSVGDFSTQPRPYRDANTSSLVLFPLAQAESEKTIQLRIGSTTITKTVDFKISPSGDLRNSLLPDLKKEKGGHTATKISDGRVVLIGGSKNIANDPIGILEIFNPESGRTEFLTLPNASKKASLEIPRSQHTATYIGINNSPVGKIDGPVEQILVIGGFSKDGLLEDTIEIVEIKAGTSQATSTLLKSKKAHLKKARIFHTSSLLPDGRILIAGGQGRISMSDLGALGSIEIFDPVTKTVVTSPFNLSTPRLLHTATALQDGDILITGGFTNESLGKFGVGPATGKTELINNNSFSIKDVGELNVPVGGHSANLLSNGFVLIVGGNSDLFSGNDADNVNGITLGVVQYYNNQAQSFKLVLDKSTGGSFGLQESRFLHDTAFLPNGTCAVIGGLNIKASSGIAGFINTPVSQIEIFELDLLSANAGDFKAVRKTSLNSSVGRIQPTAVLVTPRQKNYGFLTASSADKFINSAVFIAGGFTNGAGKLPAKITELLQIESNSGVEGRNLKLNPEAVIQGSYLSSFLIEVDNFLKVPSLKVEPQTINLSSSNNFMAVTKIFASDNQNVLLKAEVQDSNSSVIVSPSLFQTGEEITISKKDESVQGEFDILISPVESTGNFIPARIKVSVSSVAKPFLATVPGFGISLSTQDLNKSEVVQVKVLSQDGTSQLTSIPPGTRITAMIDDSKIANLGGVDISSVTGTLNTQFNVSAVMPGKTNLNFSIDFPDVLPVKIPVEVTGTPVFSGSPIDSTVLNSLGVNGISQSGVSVLDQFTVAINDFSLSSDSPLFPVYVPINLKSSVDNSNLSGQFTIRPVFGLDLSTALPRTLVNNQKLIFRPAIMELATAVAGFAGAESSPVAVVGFSDGIRKIFYDEDSSSLLDGDFDRINKISDVSDLKVFSFGSNKKLKIAALKESMIIVFDLDTGEVETSVNLSSTGQKMELTQINGQTAGVVSLGKDGIDLVFPLTDAGPRVENSKISAGVKSIAVVNKLATQAGPFVVSYDASNTITIRNLVNLNEQVRTIAVNEGVLSKIYYAGRFAVNSMITDVLLGVRDRSVFLYDLNNLALIPFNENLDIKTKIEDVVIIDGIAYLALGKHGILALSVGALIDNNKQAEITQFTKNKLIVVNVNGKQKIRTKKLVANKLADSRPFLLSTGLNNDLTVIRVTP